MQKIKYLTLFFNTILFFSTKRCKVTHYILFKLNNKRELQNIAINHSADIGYKDFIKIHRICNKEPFNFLTIDTTKGNKFIKNYDEIL